MSFLIEKFVFRPGCCDVLPGSDDQTTVGGPCYFCGARQEVTVKSAALERFRQGGFVQDCFSDLAPGKREFLVSGICEPCWDKTFPEEDDAADAPEND